MPICDSKSNFTVQGFLIKKKKKKPNKALLRLYAITVAGARCPSFAEHDHSNEQTSVMLVFFFLFLILFIALVFFLCSNKEFNSIQFRLLWHGEHGASVGRSLLFIGIERRTMFVNAEGKRRPRCIKMIPCSRERQKVRHSISFFPHIKLSIAFSSFDIFFF